MRVDIAQEEKRHEADRLPSHDAPARWSTVSLDSTVNDTPFTPDLETLEIEEREEREAAGLLDMFSPSRCSSTTQGDLSPTLIASSRLSGDWAEPRSKAHAKSRP